MRHPDWRLLHPTIRYTLATFYFCFKPDYLLTLPVVSTESLIQQTRRIRLRSLVTALATTLLGGCAATQALDIEFGRTAGAAPARAFTAIRPAEDIVVLGGTTDVYTGQSRNLWDRVRHGMRLRPAQHKRVAAKVAVYQRQRDYLTRLSRRARPYLHYIVREIESRGMPMELAMLAYVESAYNPRAVSPKAAAGIWQFMPETGKVMGLRQNAWYDGRHDVIASTRAAMKFLKQLNRRFKGDWLLAMAAYNCGPMCVEAAQSRNRRAGKPTDYWSLNLPTETEHYVPQILATAQLVKAPKRYGLALTPIPDRPLLELVEADKQMDLIVAARLSGVKLAELRRLNPGLKQGKTAPQGPHQLLMPVGKGRQLRNGVVRPS